jgi:AcrR family transcriptional regulator
MGTAGNGARGGRRPDPAVDEAIRAAALELLVERGFGLTFDEVAARAGVGRTSVFRRYPTKRDLVAAVAGHVGADRMEVPDTGSLEGDLTAAVGVVQGVFGGTPLQALARHALSDALRDGEGSAVLRSLLEQRTTLVREVLARAAARGEVSDPDRAPLVADLLSGAVLVRLATGTPFPEGGEADRLARALVAAARD